MTTKTSLAAALLAVTVFFADGASATGDAGASRRPIHRPIRRRTPPSPPPPSLSRGLREDCGCADVAQADYRGSISVTASGAVCDRWEDVHRYAPNDHPHAGLEENYCRNPDGALRAWCSTEGGLIDYLCAVPYCDDCAVTDVPCGGDAACAPSPSPSPGVGAPRFCDFQLGPDAGGYCVDCDAGIAMDGAGSLTGLGRDDWRDKCSCLEPCGEGRFCSRHPAIGCVRCRDEGILHPSACAATQWSTSKEAVRECEEKCLPLPCHRSSECDVDNDDYDYLDARAVEDPCPLCPEGFDEEDFVHPGWGGGTCGDIGGHYKTVERESDECAKYLDFDQAFCCPTLAESPCKFCPGGIAANTKEVVPEGHDYLAVTCGELIAATPFLEESSKTCSDMSDSQFECCPAAWRAALDLVSPSARPPSSSPDGDDAINPMSHGNDEGKGKDQDFNDNQDNQSQKEISSSGKDEKEDGGRRLAASHKVFFCNFAERDNTDAGDEPEGTCASCIGLLSTEDCGARSASPLGSRECVEVCEGALPPPCRTNVDCGNDDYDYSYFCNDGSRTCERCPGDHCGIGPRDGASLENCVASCNTRCDTTTQGSSYQDGEELPEYGLGTETQITTKAREECTLGCSDRVPCPSSPGAMYCDYNRGNYGTCRECRSGEDEDEQREECFFSGLPLQAAQECANACKSTLAAASCKFCGESISADSLQSVQEGDALCNFCPDGLKKSYNDRVIRFLGIGTTCRKMNQFFRSYKIAEDNPNCQLAVSFNYICDCGGSGYAGAKSDAEKIALVWVPRISAILSFFGSSAIVVDILRDSTKRAKVRGQLLVMMSIFDLLGSVAYALTSLPVPDESGIKGSRGNDVSCTVQGFFVQIGTIAALLNASLATYYYLAVTLGWSDHKIRKKKYWLFICPIAVGLAFACAGLPSLYGMLFTWCNNTAQWWPEIPVIMAILLTTFLYASMYWNLYKTEQGSNQYAMGGGHAAAVFKQACWYLIPFYLTWLPYVALQYKWSSGSGYSSYAFVIIACTLVPLQGFWNGIIYFRIRAIETARKVASKVSSVLRSAW